MAISPMTQQDFLKELDRLARKDTVSAATPKGGAASTAMKILAPVLKGIGIIDTPRRAIISGAREIIDVLDSDPTTNASLSDFVNQTKDVTYGFGTAFPIKNKWGGRLIGFFGDVLLDPWTYATLGGAIPARATMQAITKGGKVIAAGGKTRALAGGIKYVHGRSGRLALANLAKDRMEAMAQAGIRTFSADDIGKVFRDVASQGKKALPGYMYDDLGIRGPGIYFFGSRLKLPGSGPIGQGLENLVTGTRLAFTKNAAGKSILRYITPDSTFQVQYIENQQILRDRVHLATGTLENGDLMTPQQALDANARLQMNQNQRIMTAETREAVTLEVKDVITDARMEANRFSLVRLLETESEGALDAVSDPFVRLLGEKVRFFFNRRFEEIVKFAEEVSPAYAASFKKRLNHVPHMESDDAIVDRLKMGEEAFRTRTGGAAIDETHRFASSYRTRKLKKGDNFFGWEIEDKAYTIDELNDMARHPGPLPNPHTNKPFEPLEYDFYETDLVRILEKYSEHFAAQQGHTAYLLTAKQKGGSFFRVVQKDVASDPLVAVDTADTVGVLTHRLVSTAGDVTDAATVATATIPVSVVPESGVVGAVAPPPQIGQDVVSALDNFGSTLDELNNLFEIQPEILSNISGQYEKIRDTFVREINLEGRTRDVLERTAQDMQILARDLKQMVDMGNYAPKRAAVINSPESGTRLGFNNVLHKKIIEPIRTLIKGSATPVADTLDVTVKDALKQVFNTVDKQLFASSEAKFRTLKLLYERAQKLKNIRRVNIVKPNLSVNDAAKYNMQYGFALEDMHIFGNIIRGIDERIKQYSQFNFGPSVLSQQEIKDIVKDITNLYASQIRRQYKDINEIINQLNRMRELIGVGGEFQKSIFPHKMNEIKKLLPDLNMPLNTKEDYAQFIRTYRGNSVREGLLDIQRRLLAERLAALEVSPFEGVVLEAVLGRKPKTALEISNEIVAIPRVVEVKATRVTVQTRRRAQLKKYPQNEQKMFNEHLAQLERKAKDIQERQVGILRRRDEVRKIQIDEQDFQMTIFERIERFLYATDLMNDKIARQWFRPSQGKSTRFRDYFLETVPMLLGKNERYSNFDDIAQKFINENIAAFDLLDTLLTKNPNAVIDTADFEMILEIALQNSARTRKLILNKAEKISGRKISNYDDLYNFLNGEFGFRGWETDAGSRTNREVANGLLASLLDDFKNDVGKIAEFTMNEIQRNVKMADRAVLMAEQQIALLKEQSAHLLPDEYFAKFRNSTMPEKTRLAVDEPIAESPIINRINPETGEIIGQQKQNLAANKQMLLEEDDFYPQAKAVLNRMKNLQQLAQIDGHMVDWTFGGKIQILYNNKPISFTFDEWTTLINPRTTTYIPNDKIQYVVSRLKDEDLRRIILGSEYTDQFIPDDEMLQKFATYIYHNQNDAWASQATFESRGINIREAWNKSDANKFLHEHTRVKNLAAEEVAKRQPRNLVSGLDREIKGLDNQIEYLTTENIKTQEWWQTYGSNQRGLNTVKALEAKTNRMKRLTELEYSDVYEDSLSLKDIPADPTTGRKTLKPRPKPGGSDYKNLAILGVPLDILDAPKVKVLNEWLRSHPEIINSILANFNDINIDDMDQFILMAPTTREMRDQQIEILQIIQRGRLETKGTKGKSIAKLIREKSRLFTTAEEDKELADVLMRKAEQRARKKEVQAMPEQVTKKLGELAGKEPKPIAAVTPPPAAAAPEYMRVGGGLAGRGTPIGDAKDIAMRKNADSAIVELIDDTPSSSRTTIETLGPVNENSKIIMLARNGEFRNQPLKEITILQIKEAHRRGAKFVVGDMPGVDSKFMDLLDEIGAKYTIYHTGDTPRIVRPQTPISSVSEAVPAYNPDVPYRQQMENVTERTLQGPWPLEKVEKINRLVQQFDSQYGEFDRAAQKEALEIAEATKGKIALDSTAIDDEAMIRIRDAKNIWENVEKRGTATPTEEVLLDAGTKEAEIMIVASRLPETEVEARMMDGLASMARPATGALPFTPEETGVMEIITKGWFRLGQKYYTDINVSPEFYALWQNAKYFEDPKFVREMTRLIGGYTKFHKAWATFTPGFHVRNLIGNVFQYVLAGGQIAHYRRATEIFFEWNNAYRKGISWKKFLETLSPEEQIFASKARTASLGSGGGIYSDLFQDLVPGNMAYSNPPTRFSRRLGQKSDNMSRFVLGYDSAVQGMSLDMTIARIQRFYFDYEDLSKLDRAMKQFIPFWIWTSRNLPLQLQNMWLNPKPYQIYNSLVRNLRDKETEEDQPLPDWLAQINAFRLPGLPLYAAPDLGFTRAMQQIDQLTMPKKFGSNLNPLIRIPIEQTLGQNLFNDEKLETTEDRIVNLVQGSVVSISQVDRLLNSYGDAKINAWLSFFGSPIKKIKKE